ncbi:MAG: hypothetical protein SFT90_06825 [Rickettsiales bacterium]|nr:hypothetical protein [Rickettsiales bacterium]
MLLVKLRTIVILAFVSSMLSSCFGLALFGAGAGAGYIISNERNKGSKKTN